MTSPTSHTEVLIVGGGPVGLSLALDLAWRGRASMLIEKGDGNVRHSKMGSIAVRTMEFCRRWGITSNVEHAGFPDEYPLNQVYCTSLGGYLIGASHYPAMRDQVLAPESPEKYRRCPQLFFDPMMAACVRDTGMTDLCYRTELLSIDERDDRVLVELRDVNTDMTRQVSCDFLVGCDGPGSTVRKSLGIAMNGISVLSYSTGIYLRVPGLHGKHTKPRAERYVLIGPEGNWGSLTTVDGDGLWRLTVNGTRTVQEDFDPRWWVERALGDPSISYEIDDVLPWRRGQLVAERYSSKRVFLAGDSGHIMAPNGGYGMNTGLADAVDLSWKLDAVLSGWGGTSLLQSYDLERRPVGNRNVSAAASNFKNANPEVTDAMFADGAEGEAERLRFGRLLEEATRAQWERLGIVLGYRYEMSPICVPDGTPEPNDDRIRYVPTSRPGHRAPHAWISSGYSTLDLFGRSFVLLCFGEPDRSLEAFSEAFRNRGVPLSIERIDSPTIAKLYERRLVLVRPDGHVCFRADELHENAGEIADIVRGELPLQDNREREGELEERSSNLGS